MTREEYDLWMRAALFRMPEPKTCVLCGKNIVAGEWFRSGHILNAHETCLDLEREKMAKEGQQ